MSGAGVRMLKRNEAIAMAAALAGVLWYVYRQREQAAAVAAAPTPIDYINPASEHFVANQAARAVGIDLQAAGRRLGGWLYEVTH